MATIRVSSVTMKIDQARMAAIVGEATNVGVGRMARFYVRQIKESFVPTGRFIPSPPGRTPGTGTGNLRRSITSTQPYYGRAMVGTNVKYAKIQEYGGTIRAKNVKALTIPLNPLAAKMRANVETLKSIPNLQFRKLFGKNIGLLVTATKSGRGKRHGRPMFLLRRSVTLPARPFIRPAARNTEWRQQSVLQFKAGFVMILRRHFKAAAAAGAPVA